MALRLFIVRAGRRHVSLAPPTTRASSIRLPQRRFTSSSHHSKNEVSSKKKPSWNDPGTLLIWSGWSVLALLVLDQGLQYYQTKSKRDFLGEVQAYRDPPDDADHYDWMTRETLYQRRIKRVPEMDGYKCLHNVQVGDIVDVVEQHAGPEDEYSVCRLTSKDGEVHVGWFPTVDLEEIVEEEVVGPDSKKKKKAWYKIW